MPTERTKAHDVHAKIVLSIAILSALAFLACATWVYLQPLPALDKDVLDALQSWQHPLLTAYFNAITWVGSKYVLIPLGLITLGLLIYGRWTIAAWFYALGFAGASLAASLVKIIIDRGRPMLSPSLVEMPANAAFPSGHATQITAYGLCIILLIQHIHPRWQPQSAIILCLIVASVAFSRIYLQVHYPTDVIGGILLAISWVMLIYWLFGRYGLFLEYKRGY